MKNSISGKIAVITGAASGIGLTVAEYFATEGAKIVAVDLNEEVLEVVKKLPGGGHRAIVKDLIIPKSATEVIEETVNFVGIPQILINSAGVALLKPATELSPEWWQKTLDINLSGTFYMSQAAGRVMLPAKYGRIINLASQAAVIGINEHAAYCASKGGVVALTRVLSLEWARKGITVNAVSPTVVETPLGIKAWAGEKGVKAKEAIPVGRFAKPEEVAALIAFLASDDAAMITGAEYLIDGGNVSI